jgi:hypothetical protein
MEVKGKKVKLSIWVRVLWLCHVRRSEFEARIQQDKNVFGQSPHLIIEVLKG